jgi:rhodanese-related sulfurtransferase
MSREGPGRLGLGRRAWDVLFEALCLAGIGAALALGVNALSPRGLSLTRDPFRLEARQTPGTGSATSPVHGGPGASPFVDAAEAALAARLEAQELVLVRSNRVEQLFRDPRREAQLVVFVDARDEPKYEVGHIPGAYQLDPYRPERELPSLLSVCATAEQIVVYCQGADCEDSELAAVMLRDAGVPGSRLLVYAGGLGEWTTNGLPVELGARGSGRLQSSGP